MMSQHSAILQKGLPQPSQSSAGFKGCAGQGRASAKVPECIVLVGLRILVRARDSAALPLLAGAGAGASALFFASAKQRAPCPTC